MKTSGTNHKTLFTEKSVKKCYQLASIKKVNGKWRYRVSYKSTEVDMKESQYTKPKPRVDLERKKKQNWQPLNLNWHELYKKISIRSAMTGS